MVSSYDVSQAVLFSLLSWFSLCFWCSSFLLWCLVMGLFEFILINSTYSLNFMDIWINVSVSFGKFFRYCIFRYFSALFYILILITIHWQATYIAVNSCTSTNDINHIERLCWLRLQAICHSREPRFSNSLNYYHLKTLIIVHVKLSQMYHMIPSFMKWIILNLIFFRFKGYCV